MFSFYSDGNLLPVNIFSDCLLYPWVELYLLGWGMGNLQGRCPTVSDTKMWKLGKAEGWKSLFSPGDPRSKEFSWEFFKEHEVLQGKKLDTFPSWPARKSYLTKSERFWWRILILPLRSSCPGGYSCLLYMGALVKKQYGQKNLVSQGFPCSWLHCVWGCCIPKVWRNRWRSIFFVFHHFDSQALNHPKHPCNLFFRGLCPEQPWSTFPPSSPAISAGFKLPPSMSFASMSIPEPSKVLLPFGREQTDPLAQNSYITL